MREKRPTKASQKPASAEWCLRVAAVAGLIGAAGAAAFPKHGQAVGDRFDIWMTPPSGVSGESPQLTTGWHYTGGVLNALDWDNTDSNSNVYFRGYFKLANHTTKEWPLTAYPVVNSQGDLVCDVLGEWIVENGFGLRAIPMYMHVTDMVTTEFAIATRHDPQYADRRIAVMQDLPDGDAGCDWIGSHVHEYHVPDENWDSTPNVSENQHMDPPPPATPTFYPIDGNYISTYRNDDIYNFTRNFYWNQGD